MKAKQLLLMLISLSAINITNASAQADSTKYRIARVAVYPEYLNEYKASLTEDAAVAVKVDPGGVALQAVYDQANPTAVTAFKVYANEDAYQFHLKTPYFLKYKNGTVKMVESLELIEISPITMEIKPELLKTIEDAKRELIVKW